MKQHDIVVNGIEIDLVEYDWIDADRGNMYQPPEPGGAEVYAIHIGGNNIMEWLVHPFIEDVTARINEIHKERCDD